MPEVHLIDHDTDNLQYVYQLMQSVGYQVYCYHSTEMFLEQKTISQSQPGCLLIELNLPQLSGVALYQRLQWMHAGYPVIFFSQSTEPATIVQLIKQGAYDFLKKPLDAEHLFEKVRRAVDHHAICMYQSVKTSGFQQLFESLTIRERQILQMILHAMNTKEISRRLDICVKTVSRHRMNLLDKLHCKNEIELVSRLLKFQMVTLNADSVRLEINPREHSWRELESA